MEIDVNYESGARVESKNYIDIIFTGYLVLSVLILAICLAIYKLSNIIQPSTSPATSSITAPVTPMRSSPISTEQSPQTPQPFVDYVRKTIDETPYYRREARRRFNPQNTY